MPDERAERKLRGVWCEEIDPRAKWAVKIDGKWKYTIHAALTTGEGLLWIEDQDDNLYVSQAQVLAEFNRSEWQARVKL